MKIDQFVKTAVFSSALVFATLTMNAQNTVDKVEDKIDKLEDKYDRKENRKGERFFCIVYLLNACMLLRETSSVKIW